jgi:lactate permease
MIVAWGMMPIKEVFNAIGQVQFEFPGLHNVITDKDGKLIPHIYKFNYLSAAGTAILLSAIISIPLIGLKFSDGIRIFLKTLKQLKYPLITIASVLAFAYIVNDSGITITMAEALANTGSYFLSSHRFWVGLVCLSLVPILPPTHCLVNFRLPQLLQLA